MRKTKYKVKVVVRVDPNLPAVRRLEYLSGVTGKDGRRLTIYDLPELIAEIMNEPHHVRYREQVGRKVPKSTGRGTLFRARELFDLYKTKQGPYVWLAFDRIVMYRVTQGADDAEGEVQ
jgi:hypothetical protein